MKQRNPKHHDRYRYTATNMITCEDDCHSCWDGLVQSAVDPLQQQMGTSACYHGFAFPQRFWLVLPRCGQCPKLNSRPALDALCEAALNHRGLSKPVQLASSFIARENCVTYQQ